MLGRAKSCQWQVFVRRRPPKQGELRTDVSKATMFQGDDSVLRPRFKALSKKILAELSGDTSRNRFFVQNGGEKALNRCEAPVLQRKDLEWRLKEQPYSLQTVGYGWVRMGSGGGKRVVLESNKKGLCKRKAFGLKKRAIFFRFIQSQPIKKSFLLTQQNLYFPPHPN